MILNMYMSNEFYHVISYLYNKFIMFDILKMCVYIFCNQILYCQMRWLSDGNCFGCDQGDEDANPILNMLLS
jgi:hypothetical protein